MFRLRRHVLSSTTVLFGVASVLLSNPAAAFDPYANAPGPQPNTYQPVLPDTAVLYGGRPSPITYAPAPATPITYAPTAPMPPIAYAPAPPLASMAPAAGAPGYISPIPQMQMPVRPLYPADRAVSAQPAPMPAPQYPPVSPEVAARANQIIQQQGPAPVQPMPPITYAPAPVVPVAAAPQAPMAPAAPVVAAVVAPAAPAPQLSDQTRAILSGIPSSVGTTKPAKGGEITMNRVSPEISAILGAGEKEDQFEAVGLSIKVRRPGLDANYELNRAYTALMGGETEQAIGTYKDILSSDPKNQDALFGLAATYHRTGNIDKARPLYGMLLKLNPNHREGLNNFLVLVGDESPQDALPELERLEQRNPDFSPIPAQTAIVLDKLGHKEQARDKMLRAIELAPDNLTYKYNLAVMLDRQGRYQDASALYKLLIEASLRGEKVPAPVDTMQKRLNFLTTIAAMPGLAGG